MGVTKHTWHMQDIARLAWAENGRSLQKKRKLSPAQPKKYGFKKAENRRFKTRHGVTYSGKNGRRQSYGQALKDIEQPAFQDICSKSQEACRKYLEEHGVILRKAKGATFRCWGCNADITEKSGWRCSKFSCKQRARITQPLLCFSPLFNQAAGGAAQIDYRLCLRSAYCLGTKLSND